MKLKVLQGTDRINSKSKLVAESVVSSLAKNSTFTSVKLIDPVALTISYSGEGNDYIHKIKDADGFIIVTPEYNHGYPGTLKTMLDMAYSEYNHRPVGIVPVSGGTFGGARMTESLISVLKAIGLSIIKYDCNIFSVNDHITDNTFTMDSSTQKRFDGMVEELIWHMRVLKWGRENIK